MTDPFLDTQYSDELGSVAAELARIGDLADGVARALSRALRGAITDGRSLNTVLGEIARSFSDIALKAALKPLGTLAGGLVETLFTATNPALQGVRPFAKGGVIATPSYFPLDRGFGLAGEAGPEAVLPLARGSDGRLGVAAGSARPITVTVNVRASDVRSFLASEAEISAMLLRAVRRGQRAS